MTRAASLGVRDGMVVDKEHRAEVVHWGWMARVVASFLFLDFLRNRKDVVLTWEIDACDAM